MLDTERTLFFLSYTELLLACEVAKQNVVIFGCDTDSAIYLGSILGHSNSDVALVGLRVQGGQTRVRSHFERLIPDERFMQIRQRWSREALQISLLVEEPTALLAERRRISAEDTLVRNYDLLPSRRPRVDDAPVPAPSSAKRPGTRSECTAGQKREFCLSRENLHASRWL